MDPIILSVIYLIGLTLIITLYIWMSNHFYIRQTLGYIPQPKTYPFIGLYWKIRSIPQEDRLKWFNDLCFSFKDGMVVTWFGTHPTVNIRKPRHMETILSINTFISKMEQCKKFTPWLGNGVLISTEGIWFSRRQFVKAGFHSDVLEKYMIVILKKVQILIECIHAEINLNLSGTINIFNLTYKYALDTICEIAFGIDIDTQRNINNEYVLALHKLYQTLTNVYSQSWITWNSAFYQSNSEKEMSKAIQIMHDYTEKVIIQKQINRKQNKLLLIEDNDYEKYSKCSFIDILLNKNESTESPLTLQEIREEVNTFIFAGHNTISSAISWSLFILGNNQNIQRKLQRELRQVFGAGNESMTIAELEQLQYLDRVIKEVLRLYPSLPTIDRTLNNNAVIDYYFIPKGTVVKLHIYQLHHDPEVWEDPETFNPDRFLPENCIKRNPYAYIPFSGGSRNCIGQKLAFLQIKIVLILILRKWKVSSILKPNEMKMTTNFNLKPYNEKIQLYLTPINKSNFN